MLQEACQRFGAKSPTKRLGKSKRQLRRMRRHATEKDVVRQLCACPLSAYLSVSHTSAFLSTTQLPTTIEFSLDIHNSRRQAHRQADWQQAGRHDCA